MEIRNVFRDGYIEMDIKEIGCEYEDWIHLVQDMFQ
jgi:hypothetical protein